MDNELRTALNKIDGVTIIAGLSVNTYRGVNRDISKIKSDLNVDYILAGAITVNGGKTSLLIDFIKANDLSTIWSETIQATPDTVFDSKIQIAMKLASSLKIQLGDKTSEAIGTKHTANAEAFRLYTQGRERWMTRSQAGMKQSIKFYEQAIELDNKFALAYSGIADTYSMMAVYGFMDIHTAYPKARKFVLDAISRNPTLPEAYISLGWIQFAYEWKLKDSEDSAKKIVEAEEESKKMLAKAKSEAKQIMDNAKTQSEKIVEESKNKATEEKERIVGSAQAEIEKEVVNAKKSLEKDFSTSVMSAVKKIISKEVSSSDHQDTIDKSLNDFRK